MTARLQAKDVLRYTPAGIPALNCQLQHESRQMEAGEARQVEWAADAVAFGSVARRLAEVAAGSLIECVGFVAPRSRRSRQVELHITEFEILEGN
ncbi:MAG: primosomal replication protein N [Betaproteobacteria bacterium]|nr:primosomal replication protein N [Betaproteobacteria bacterium]